MYNLSALYHPITANPAGGGEYLPGRLLQPYIRCYWGSNGAACGEGDAALSGAEAAEGPASQLTETIIPDSCMDIIWEWDERTGASGGIFAGLTTLRLRQDKQHSLLRQSVSPSGFTSGPFICSQTSR